MKHFAIFALVYVVPVTLMAQEKDAKAVAQEVLDKGSALFDTRDAAAMAATYTEDAQLLWVDKDNSTGEIKVSVKKDRSLQGRHREDNLEKHRRIRPVCRARSDGHSGRLSAERRQAGEVSLRADARQARRQVALEKLAALRVRAELNG
jgi:hypothetical protein